LCALLQFPSTISNEDTAPQEFALQFWDDQKQANASLVIGIMGMLIGLKGNTVRACTLRLKTVLANQGW
jgi:intracellular protein transport protein USO1